MYSLRFLIILFLFLPYLLFSFVYATDKPLLINNEINPLSIVRNHDRVNYMVSLTDNNGEKTQHWHSVDCKQNKAQFLYKDVLNEDGLTKARYYGNSYFRYAPAQDNKLMASENIRMICQLPIKEVLWEKLSDTSMSGITDLVDINSIQHIGDILSVRTGYDFAETIWEPPYDAPLELKIEHYLYNCKTHQGDAIVAMNLDREGYVTDSLITDDIIRRKDSFKIDLKMRQLFNQLCQLPEGKKFTAEGHFVPAINKPASTFMRLTMPDLSNNNPYWFNKFPLSTAINNKTQSLVKPLALPHFKQISYTIVNEYAKINVQLVAQPDGYIRKLEDYGIWTVQRLTLVNQLQLKFAMSISHDVSVLRKLQTDLKFPLVVGQQYQAQWESIDSKKEVIASSIRCNVISEGDARNIASEFSGKYLLVQCHETHQGQLKISSKQAWLQDFNVFVPVIIQLGDRPESSVKLENVNIIR